MRRDPNAMAPVPIRGADPMSPHPVQRAWRGVCELAEVSRQGLLALSELVRPRCDDIDPPSSSPSSPSPPPPPTSRLAETLAPFPVDD